MLTRIFDLLIGLCIGRYVPSTIPVFGFDIAWDLILLGVLGTLYVLKLMFNLFKKLFWTKLKKSVKKAVKDIVKEALQEELNN